jgi:UDP-N-acetylmuramate--alanine ligase
MIKKISERFSLPKSTFMQSKIHHIHFVGIKGVGLTPLAIIAKEAGLRVSGSDIEEEFITDSALRKVGITPFTNFSENHITGDIDLVITTGAHGGYDNIEVRTARKKSIPVLTKGEAVGKFMQGNILGRKFSGISVAGSHGKTTTTGMIVSILKHAGYDPSYVVGTGSISSMDLPGHLGRGKYFVAEADEYATEPTYNHKPQFLWQFPDIALFTNIEHDHPDIYPTHAAVVNAFEAFTHNISSNGVLIGCRDDKKVYSLIKHFNNRTITYGFSPQSDYVIENVHVIGSKTLFKVKAHGREIGEFCLQVIGEHNALNALGALIVGVELGISIGSIREGLSLFNGVKRRLEFKGQLKSGAYIFDDYAHHPTEIAKTLQALRMRYPKEKIIAVFQPHTYSRTKALFTEFTKAFHDADEVILVDIYGSLREIKDPSISSKLLAASMSKHNTHYIPTLEEVASYIKKESPNENVVIVFMGAGDVYKTIDLINLIK